MNAPELVAVLMDYGRAALAGGDPALPAALATRSFS
jgi:hypothetical protein